MTFRDVLGGGPAEGVPWHPHDASDISGDGTFLTLIVSRLIGGVITGEEIIIAGGVLGILRSDNFVAGSAGWRALGDGTFEAQDGIFRGTLNADDLNAGTLDVDRIAVKTLAAEKLIIGSVDNLIQNPGFEDGVLAPHVLVDSSTGTWSIEAIVPRSGAESLRYFFGSSMTFNARVALNGLRATRESHPAVAEGDVIYFTAWCRDASPNGTTNVRLSIFFYDETGSQLSVTSSSSVDVAGYQQLEISATAPAGAAYVVCEPQVLATSTATTGAVHFDDCYARRKVGTLIIEDQAVDIERMLNPVFQGGADTGANNKSITSTMTDQVTASITLPSWVGEANVFCQARLDYSNADSNGVGSPFTVRSKIAGVTADTRDGFVSGDDTSSSVSLAQFRNISAPGSSISVAMGASTTSGTSTENENDIVAVATGIR
jgi:hypothetical protein